jgi:hypothetical protein
VITSKFWYTYYGVCICDFPWSTSHVLPNFGLPCLVHCPSVLVVNCSESSDYGCDADFVFFSATGGGITLHTSGLGFFTQGEKSSICNTVSTLLWVTFVESFHRDLFKMSMYSCRVSSRCDWVRDLTSIASIQDTGRFRCGDRSM